jgi:hypothetical protein
MGGPRLPVWLRLTRKLISVARRYIAPIRFSNVYAIHGCGGDPFTLGFPGMSSIGLARVAEDGHGVDVGPADQAGPTS